MKSFKTEKGTELPLLNLRGKPYLQVAHRIVWLEEDAELYSINTDIIKLTDDSAVIKASILIKDKGGMILRRADATKSETKSGFPDFVEKAETGAIGRALALLGYGTQFTADELDEGNRLADSPIKPAKKRKSSAEDF